MAGFNRRAIKPCSSEQTENQQPNQKTSSKQLNAGTSPVNLPYNQLRLLIPLLTLAQVVIYYSKSVPMFYVQTDSLRRHESWRLLTPFLVHEEDLSVMLPNEHLWINMLLQMYFGWKLEATLGSRNTFIVYVNAVVFGSLISSAKAACSMHSVYGLAAANLSAHVLLDVFSVGGRHIYFAHILSPELAIRVNFRDALLAREFYERFSRHLCKTYWRSYTEGNQSLFESVRTVVQMDDSSNIDGLYEVLQLKI